MPYIVTQEIRKRAKELGVTVKSSTDPAKKLDVYQEGKKIASIGQAGSNDYHLWQKQVSKAYADQRRKLYYMRHPYKTRMVNGVYTADYLAKQLLW